MPKSKPSLVTRTSGGRGRHTDIIEITTKRDAVRRSKIAFWAVSGVVGLTTGVIASGITNVAGSVLIGVLTGLIVGTVVAVVLFCWPAIRVAWHWAAEILTLAGFLAAYLLLIQVMPWWAAVAILVALVGGPLAVPAIRRRVVPWVWCAITRHRLRFCFAASIASQRSGLAPLILLARPIPAGERVWIWLRPGLALADLESRMDRLATGCWAAECRIAPASRRYAALLRIDIARRNPLNAPVGSPLPGLVPALETTPGIFVAVPGGLDLPDVPDAVPAEPVEGKRGLRGLTQIPAARQPAVADVITPVRVVDDLEDWI